MTGRIGLTEQGVRRTRETWFRRVLQLLTGPALDEGTFDALEELLIGADVGVATASRLIERLRQRARTEPIRDSVAATAALKQEMVDILRRPVPPSSSNGAKPHVVLVVGVNGSGKTTSIAKLAWLARARGQRVVLAAADTFRAAAIDQLGIWAERVGADVVAHRPGADPGAVAFDAHAAAKARGADLMIVDTAGRLHTKHNLMAELSKVRNVLAKAEPSAPQEVLLVLDATTGQNGLAQARNFTEAVAVTGIFLAKLDGTAKGGIVFAIAAELGIPIRYIGTGEAADDIVEFEPEAFVEALFA